MIVQVEGLNLLPGAGELLSQCVDDLDEDNRALSAVFLAGCYCGVWGN